MIINEFCCLSNLNLAINEALQVHNNALSAIVSDLSREISQIGEDNEAYKRHVSTLKNRNAELLAFMHHFIHDMRQFLQIFSLVYDMDKDEGGVKTLVGIREQLDSGLSIAAMRLDALCETARAEPNHRMPLTDWRLDGRSADVPAPAPSYLPCEDDDRPKLFVIDDNIEVALALKKVLERHGYAVETFASGAAFFDACRPDDDGCVLVDSIMPGMNGCEIIERLRAENYLVRAIMMTGSGDVPMAVRAMKAGASDFFEKPFDAYSLLAAIEGALKTGKRASPERFRREIVPVRLAALTKRQRQILALIMDGRSNKRIATQLNLSQRTVESHRAAIMKKTGATSFAELIRWAIVER
jgi:FixJ family two-component response regulator